MTTCKYDNAQHVLINSELNFNTTVCNTEHQYVKIIPLSHC